MKFFWPAVIMQKVDIHSFGVVICFILNQGKLSEINIIEVANGTIAPIPKSIKTISGEIPVKFWKCAPEEQHSFDELIQIIQKS